LLRLVDNKCREPHVGILVAMNPLEKDQRFGSGHLEVHALAWTFA